MLNVTPDSFFDGSRLTDPAAAAQAAARAVAEGADVLDVGGESTRPGSARVPAEEQLRRVLPAIRAIRAAGGHESRVPISVDTTLAAVAREAIEAGADAINDVSAGADDEAMLTLAAERGVGLILMHRIVSPPGDSYSDRYASSPEYGDVAGEVRSFLSGRARAAQEAGVAPECIALDPGLGFGKSVEQNLELIRRTRELASLGYPVVSALSRKSFVGRVGLGRDSEPAERLAPTIALSVAHGLHGARLFRVHDVAPHAEALRAAWAVAPHEGSVP